MMSFYQLDCENSKDNQDDVYLLYTVDGDSTEYRYPAYNEVKMCEHENEGHEGSEYTRHQWNCENMVKFNSKVVFKLYVGNYTSMPTITFKPADFTALGAVTSQEISDATTDIWTEIDYRFSGRLLASPDGQV